MSDDLAELLEIFLRESFERVGNLRQAAIGLERSAEAVVVVRRELHTLKGCSRLVGLDGMADACAEGERWVEDEAEGLVERLLALADSLERQLGEVVVPGSADEDRSV